VIEREEPEEEKRVEPIAPGVAYNCYAYTKSLIPDLPGTNHILANLTPEISDVAVFYYPKSGLYHYAKVTWSDGYNFGILESNYRAGQITERNLSLDYPNLIGFYRVY
jgi:hypothetical protein